MNKLMNFGADRSSFLVWEAEYKDAVWGPYTDYSRELLWIIEERVS